MPNTYVSYQTAESADPTFTDVFPNSDNPVWDHQNETRLSTELLYQENRVSLNDKSDRHTMFTVLIYFTLLLPCCHHCVMVWAKSSQSEHF